MVDVRGFDVHLITKQIVHAYDTGADDDGRDGSSLAASSRLRCSDARVERQGLARFTTISPFRSILGISTSIVYALNAAVNDVELSRSMRPCWSRNSTILRRSTADRGKSSDDHCGQRTWFWPPHEWTAGGSTALVNPTTSPSTARPSFVSQRRARPMAVPPPTANAPIAMAATKHSAPRRTHCEPSNAATNAVSQPISAGP